MAMRWGQNKYKWAPWFAWRPVRLGDAPNPHGEWVWLEWVERSWWEGNFRDWPQYRIPATEHA